MEPTVSPELTRTSFTVDKLSLTLKIRKQRWSDVQYSMHKRFEVQRGGKTYRESTQVKGGPENKQTMMIQWSPFLGASLPFARVEWNPMKFEGWQDVLEDVLRPFLKHGWGDCHVTRIDPAVDYPVKVQEHVYYARNHKGQLHYTRDGIETIYLGSPRSNSRIRIYDKAKELEVMGEPVPDHPLTRIEAQKRSTQISAFDIRQLKDPFIGMKIGKPDTDKLDFEYQLYFEKGKEIGIDAVIKRLGWRKKAVVKAVIAENRGAIPHPSTMFNLCYVDFCKKHFSYFWEHHTPRVSEAEASKAWRLNVYANA